MDKAAPRRADPPLYEQTEQLWLRRCRACGWEGPGYLDWCRRCPAAMGEPYRSTITLFTPDVAYGALAPQFQLA